MLMKATDQRGQKYYVELELQKEQYRSILLTQGSLCTREEPLFAVHCSKYRPMKNNALKERGGLYRLVLSYDLTLQKTPVEPLQAPVVDGRTDSKKLFPHTPNSSTRVNPRTYIHTAYWPPVPRVVNWLFSTLFQRLQLGQLVGFFCGLHQLLPLACQMGFNLVFKFSPGLRCHVQLLD